MLYSIGMAILGISGLNLPPFLVCDDNTCEHHDHVLINCPFHATLWKQKQVLFAGVMLLMWVFGAPIMSASVTLLNDSPFARDADLNMLYLQIATVSNVMSV